MGLATFEVPAAGSLNDQKLVKAPPDVSDEVLLNAVVKPSQTVVLVKDTNGLGLTETLAVSLSLQPCRSVTYN